MIDVPQLLKRQAQWQKSRQTLSWPEKIRMAEMIRDSVEALASDGRRRRTSVVDPSVPRTPGSAESRPSR